MGRQSAHATALSRMLCRVAETTLRTRATVCRPGSGPRYDEVAMTTAQPRRAADLLVECLAAEGCRFVFSVPGEETMDVLDALSRHPEVRHVTTRHEQGAAFMADVHGRLTGRVAVAMGTLGPGATNLLTGVADAYLDRAPMVALTGQASSVGSGKKVRPTVSGAGPPSAGAATSMAATFSGSSMCAGPGFSRVATRNALLTISGIAPTRSTRVFHLVTGSNILTMSTTWCASLWSFSDDAWPVIATIGARSRNASAMPVTRFVAPGPRVAIATAQRPVSRP